MKFISFNILLLLVAAPAWGQATRPAVVSVRLDELNALKAEVERLRGEVARLAKENAKLREAVAPTPKEVQRDAKIRQAIKDGTLCVGMTLEEADMACRKNSAYRGYTLESESDAAKIYEFSFTGAYERGRQIAPGTSWTAWVRDGKIIEWSK